MNRIELIGVCASTWILCQFCCAHYKKLVAMKPLLIKQEPMGNQQVIVKIDKLTLICLLKNLKKPAFEHLKCKAKFIADEDIVFFFLVETKLAFYVNQCSS